MTALLLLLGAVGVLYGISLAARHGSDGLLFVGITSAALLVTFADVAAVLLRRLLA